MVVVSDRPVNTIQAKIEQYRQQTTKPPEPTDEQQPNFFEVTISEGVRAANGVTDYWSSGFAAGHDAQDHQADKDSG